jgi:hypothetical protein
MNNPFDINVGNFFLISSKLKFNLSLSATQLGLPVSEFYTEIKAGYSNY